jgi:ribose transport system permease protein
MSLSKVTTTQPSLRWRGFQEVFALLLILALIVLIMSQLSSAFMTGRNLSNLLLDATTVGIIAVFSTMLMISGGLDLSVASNAALCGVVIGVLQEPLGLGLAVFVALVTGTLVGFINGFVVTYIGINSLIATLGMLSIARGLAFVFANGLTIPVFDLTGENPEPYLAFAQLSEGRFLD